MTPLIKSETKVSQSISNLISLLENMHPLNVWIGTPKGFYLMHKSITRVSQGAVLVKQLANKESDSTIS